MTEKLAIPKAQVVRPHEPHLRPRTGKACHVISKPPICFSCGALLNPMPHAEDCDLDDCTCGAEA